MYTPDATWIELSQQVQTYCPTDKATIFQVATEYLIVSGVKTSFLFLMCGKDGSNHCQSEETPKEIAKTSTTGFRTIQRII